MLKNFTLILIIALLIVSCGTLSKSKRNIIIVDSKPRHLALYNANRELIDKTPFFYQAVPARQQYYFYDGKQDKQELYTYKCSLNWYESIIPNAIWGVFIPIGTIAAAAFMGVDALTGELYRCEENILFGEEKKITSNLPEIDHILVIPPKWSEDPELSKLIFDTWKQNQKETHNLDRYLLDYSLSEKAQYFQTISQHDSSDPRDLNRSFLNEMGYHHKASHILMFTWKQEKEDWEITPHLYDIFSLKEIKVSYLKPFKMSYKKLESPFIKRVLFSIVPNSVSLDVNTPPVVTYSSDFYYKNHTEEKSAQGGSHPKALPRLLTALSIGDVSHPNFYRTWDLSVHAAPILSITSWQSRLSNNETEYNINLQNLKLLYLFTLTGHTTFGAVGLGLGGGGLYTYGDDNKSYHYNRFSTATMVRLSYNAFVTNRFFVFLNADNIQVYGERIRNPYFTLRGWSEVSIGIGHYLPEMISLIPKVFRQ